jgi:hypothetical protein
MYKMRLARIKSLHVAWQWRYGCVDGGMCVQVKQYYLPSRITNFLQARGSRNISDPVGGGEETIIL